MPFEDGNKNLEAGAEASKEGKENKEAINMAKNNPADTADKMTEQSKNRVKSFIGGNLDGGQITQ
jgi:hypothetical protein